MILKKSLAVAAAALFAAMSLVSQATHAGPRLDKIMETKVIRVGTPGDYRPFAIKTDGGYSGHDIDVIETMAKELGVKIEYVPTSWPNLVKDLQGDKFDVAVGGITRNVNRMRLFDMLPGYAPFGKVALVRAADKAKFTSVDAMNQPGVRVIKNPGGTNETYVLANLKAAQVSTHDKNAEIPALIAEGKEVKVAMTFPGGTHDLWIRYWLAAGGIDPDKDVDGLHPISAGRLWRSASDSTKCSAVPA